MAERQRIRRMLAALAFAFASLPMAHAVAQLGLSIFFPRPNPSVLIWESHSALLWGFVVAGYVAGMVAIGGYAMAAHRPSLVARSLRWLVVSGAVLSMVQGLALP